ncbi:MAG: DUF4164 family protein [Rhodoblastus sp.]
MTEPVGSSGPAAPRVADPLDAALARLLSALATLEAAAGRKREADLVRSDLDEAFAAMQDDRARLALDLDAALARGQRLEAANDEVARRLEAAAAAIATLAQGAEGGE